MSGVKRDHFLSTAKCKRKRSQSTGSNYRKYKQSIFDRNTSHFILL